jgi:outer membrane protein assembly factor BamB
MAKFAFRRRHLVLLTPLLIALAGADWAQFRGPNGLGVSDEKGLPLKWTATENIVWKTPLPGPGASSPIVVGDRVFVTCFTGAGEPQAGGRGRGRRKGRDKADGEKKPDGEKKADGEKKPDGEKKAEEPKKKEDPPIKVHLICVARGDGKPLWDKAIDVKHPEQTYGGFVALHGYASGTPASDGQAVYTFFGRTGVFAHDLDGNELWTANVGTRTDGFGTANSPVLFENLVIINASVESGKLVALDKKNGEQKWEASGIRRSWNAPVLVPVGGKHELVVYTSGKLFGFDPASGEKLWECDAKEDYICPSVVANDGIIYAAGGRSGGVMAVKAGGRGDVTDTHVVWKSPTSTNVPSPVYHDGHIYMVHTDNGSAYCLDAKSGEVVYQERFTPSPGRIYASPVAVDGRIYYVSREKGAYVLPAAPKFEILAHNVIDDDTSVVNGSLVVHRGQFLMRSDKNLYCIGTR